jgi:hypothetical protein
LECSVDLGLRDRIGLIKMAKTIYRPKAQRTGKLYWPNLISTGKQVIQPGHLHIVGKRHKVFKKLFKKSFPRPLTQFSKVCPLVGNSRISGATPRWFKTIPN